MFHNFLKIPKSECPDIWIRLPRHKWPKSWSSMEDPVVPLEKNLYGHPLAGLFSEKEFEKIMLKYGWEKVSKLEMLFRTPWKRIILICVCGWHQIGWKETKYWSDVEITKQRSWFGRTNIIPRSCIPGMYSKTMWNKQRYCRQLQNHVWIQNFRWGNGKIPMLGKSEYLFVVLSHGKSCQEMCGTILWVGKQDDSTTIHSINFMPDAHHFKEEELNSVGNLSKICSQIVLKCLYLARIGRPDILWSVNKLARSITKWTKACDKSLNRLISYIHHTCEKKQYCHVGNTAKQCRLGLFEDSDFAGDLEDSKSTSGGTLCIFGSHTFVPLSWMCKKQTSVSHSSTESEIMSLDLPGNTNQSKQVQGDPKKSPTRKKIPGKIDLNSVDFVSSNANSSRQEAVLYIFEDNETVIKMIIKVRSPTMRHVSRTHRVALDWLFDGINLDPKIQIKYIDTKNQLADILTKGHFTRDEWNDFLCLFNISHFSSINSVKAMSRCRVRGPTVLASTASENPVNNKSEGQKVPLSPLNVQLTGTVKPVLLASSSNSSEWNNDDKWSSQEWKSGEMSNTSTVRPVSHKVVIDIDMDSDTATESDLSPKSRSLLNRVNDRLRKMLNRSPEDLMQEIDKRSLIWWMFMSSTLEASVFMGKNYSDNLHSIKNTRENHNLKKMFEISEQLILEQSDEIFGVSQVSWERSPWKQLSLVNDEEVISLSHAKVYVFSDSVFCLGKMNRNPTSNTVWERQLEWFKYSSQYRTLDTIDGEPMEFEWNIFPGACPRNPKVHEQNGRTQHNCKDELFPFRCSLASYGELQTMNKNVRLIPHLCLYSQKDFQQSFLGPGSEI